MAPFSRFFRRITGKDVSEANGLFNLCKEIIEKSAEDFDTKIANEEHYVMNRRQCELLVKKLSETYSTLAYIQQFSILDGRIIPVLQELHRLLLDARRFIQSSSIRSSESVRAAIEQGDMKETIQKLLYDVQWHMDVLLSIPADNIPCESPAIFDPKLCCAQLKPTELLYLTIAMEEDRKALKDHLSSVNLDNATELEQDLAKQLLMRIRSVEEQLSSVSTETLPQLLNNPVNNREAKETFTMLSKDSNVLSSITSSFNLLYLDPQNLKNYRNGIVIGKGSFGEVRESNLIGGKYAIKVFEQTVTHSFDQEMAALTRLGHHPHIVHLYCHSKSNLRCFLIMELMDRDLTTFLERRADGSKLSSEEAVDLMLQIAEGVRYIHSKGMAHRDLKSANILVNLADPSKEESSRVRSVKIADFGLTKTKNASRTYANQTVNTGSTKWMAPEVISLPEGSFSTATTSGPTFNPRKADVYSFAIICSEILTGEEPFRNQFPREVRKKVKEGAIRPMLPDECPPRLASLIQRCWAGCYVDRPLFPEICKELRYVKGLVLRGDEEKLKIRDVILGFESNAESVQHQEACGYSIGDEENEISHVTASMEHIKRQGPWGASIGNTSSGVFSHVAKSIKWIKLMDNETPPGLALVEVGYVELDGIEFVERYCHDAIGSKVHKIEFGPGEFIKQVSGSVAPHEASLELHSVVSLTIYTNCKTHGPYGKDVGQRFTSGSGKVVGFHGKGGARLHTFGVWIILNGLKDGDQSFSQHGHNQDDGNQSFSPQSHNILPHQSSFEGNVNSHSLHSRNVGNMPLPESSSSRVSTLVMKLLKDGFPNRAQIKSEAEEAKIEPETHQGAT